MRGKADPTAVVLVVDARDDRRNLPTNARARAVRVDRARLGPRVDTSFVKLAVTTERPEPFPGSLPLPADEATAPWNVFTTQFLPEAQLKEPRQDQLVGRDGLLLTTRFADGRSVSAYGPEGEGQPTVIAAMRIVQSVYNERYGAEVQKLVASQDRSMDRNQVVRFVLRGSDNEIVGHQLIYAGSAADGRRVKLPVENEYPQVDLRAGGGRVYEAKRLASSGSSTTALSDLMSGMAAYFKGVFGGAEQVPNDLRILAHCVNEHVVNRLVQAGYRVIHTPEQLESPGNWILQMTGPKLIATY